jgi:hypothetical protein
MISDASCTASKLTSPLNIWGQNKNTETISKVFVLKLFEE